MAAPCKKCGATKTEPVRHDALYNLARRFGYRLRRCARCYRRRLIPLYEKDSPAMDDATLQPEETPVGEAERGLTCPRCGKSDFRRSRRRWWERLMGRTHMARCRNCHTRFPIPHDSFRAVA